MSVVARAPAGGFVPIVERVDIGRGAAHGRESLGLRFAPPACVLGSPEPQQRSPALRRVASRHQALREQLPGALKPATLARRLGRGGCAVRVGSPIPPRLLAGTETEMDPPRATPQARKGRCRPVPGVLSTTRNPPANGSISQGAQTAPAPSSDAHGRSWSDERPSPSRAGYADIGQERRWALRGRSA